MIYLHKIIPLITSPLFLALTLLIISIFLKKNKFIKLKSFLIFLSFLILFTFSNPLISNKLVKYIEAPYQLMKLSEVPQSDYIVVLSGMVHEVKDDVYEWSDPDRFFAGIKLLNANKGKKIIFTGGVLPWEKKKKTEGELLKNKSLEFGVEENDILVTKKVQNTYEEANAISHLIDNKSKIILVTSAFHMKRAEFLLKKHSFNVFSYPVDFRYKYNKITILDFIPSASSLSWSSFVIREVLGRMYYRVKFLLK
ncbi:MAG: YdcF family protein [Alphaproteobacteria bacterium]|nr:MAG: YdcF family protein [Alphaproteobacteria bacterium]